MINLAEDYNKFNDWINAISHHTNDKQDIIKLRDLYAKYQKECTLIVPFQKFKVFAEINHYNVIKYDNAYYITNIILTNTDNMSEASKIIIHREFKGQWVNKKSKYEVTVEDITHKNLKNIKHLADTIGCTTNEGHLLKKAFYNKKNNKLDRQDIKTLECFPLVTDFVIY